MNRVALIGIMIDDNSVGGQINDLLHEYADFITGRMGIPNVRENMGVISVVLDAPMDIISALSGKLGRIQGVTSKTIYSKLETK